MEENMQIRAQKEKMGKLSYKDERGIENDVR